MPRSAPWTLVWKHPKPGSWSLSLLGLEIQIVNQRVLNRQGNEPFLSAVKVTWHVAQRCSIHIHTIFALWPLSLIHSGNDVNKVNEDWGLKGAIHSARCCSFTLHVHLNKLAQARLQWPVFLLNIIYHILANCVVIIIEQCLSVIFVVYWHSIRSGRGPAEEIQTQTWSGWPDQTRCWRTHAEEVWCKTHQH